MQPISSMPCNTRPSLVHTVCSTMWLWPYSRQCTQCAVQCGSGHTLGSTLLTTHTHTAVHHVSLQHTHTAVHHVSLQHTHTHTAVHHVSLRHTHSQTSWDEALRRTDGPSSPAGLPRLATPTKGCHGATPAGGRGHDGACSSVAVSQPFWPASAVMGCREGQGRRALVGTRNSNRAKKWHPVL